jgi:hypothetical protein
VNKKSLNNLTILIVFQLVIFTFPAQAQLKLDPVVISLGDTEVSRRQFEQRFEMVMVMKALETGVPIKNQDQISVLEHRFLEQRAREMVLLKVAKQQGIQISQQELDGILDKYMQNLGYSGYSEKNLHNLGFFDESEFRDILKEKQVISLFISSIQNDLEASTDLTTINVVLEDYYDNSGVRIFPEKIDTPYLK